MCTIALAFHVHSKYPFVLASNRDEFYARPSRPAAFWEDAPDVLAGRDLRAGGTWLGVTRTGRFAALTNVRAGTEERPDAPTRGEIVADFLQSDRAPLAYARALASRADQYNGFNLLAGTPDAVVLYSNREAEARVLDPGVYGISNAVPGTEWPKTIRAKRLLEERIERNDLELDALFEMLGDADQPPDHQLPETGVGVEWERMLSSIFIQTPEYGTCASTVYRVDAQGDAVFVERRPQMAAQVVEVSEVKFHFRIQHETTRNE